MKRIKKSARGAGVLFTRGFLLNLLFMVSLTAVAVWLFVVVNSGETVLNSFDPFHILDVDAASDLKAIKKAYKTMSLKWHPDKNTNNPAAEAKFMMVAKAYEALTDPAAKDNYEKYGNSDGKQSLQVSGAGTVPYLPPPLPPHGESDRRLLLPPLRRACHQG